jgi:hypothetical protein
MRVRDVMTQDVATIAPDTDLRDVAALLVEKRISGVPVVEGGRVVGVVSERDIHFKERPSNGLSRGVLAWLMDEGDLTLKIDADPRVRSYWRRPCDYDVAVEKGVVTLTGKVGNKEQAPLIEAFVDRVPGVVGITSRLHWEDGR